MRLEEILGVLRKAAPLLKQMHRVDGLAIQGPVLDKNLPLCEVTIVVDYSDRPDIYSQYELKWHLDDLLCMNVDIGIRDCFNNSSWLVIKEKLIQIF